ncbi:MAG: hypothetical protein P9L99_18275 [Candidatus Lernaella stagnicola]|nr:hypothetical protein [Candidatus Lernaella stagnicola]
MKTVRWTVIFLLLAVFSCALFAVGCGDDDDDDNGDDDEDQAEQIVAEITAIMNEIIEGAMARTVDGLENKVFPHMSENYDYAGFDKQAYMDDELETLDESEDVSVTEYEATVEVELGDDMDTAVVTVENLIDILVLDTNNIGFDLHGDAENHGISHFVLESDGQWRVIGGEAVFSSWYSRGGDPDLAVGGMDTIAVSPQEAGPGESVRFTGTLTLPEVTGDQTLRLQANLNWQDERANAQVWWWSEECVLEEDLTEFAGQSYELDVVLPADGEPDGLSIPTTLPLGKDAIEATVTLAVTDETDAYRYDAYSVSLPFQPLDNGDPCQEGPTAGLDGLWKAEASTETEGKATVWFYQAIDFALVGDQVYGTLVYSVFDTVTEAWLPIGIEITGVLDGDWLHAGYETEGFSYEIDARFDGMQLVDGTLTITDESNTVFFDFTAEKMHNRCQGLRIENLDGVQLSVSAGETVQVFDIIDVDGIEMSLVTDGWMMDGYAMRNMIIAVSDIGWMTLAFYNDAEGWVRLSNGADPVEGTFVVL